MHLWIYCMQEDKVDPSSEAPGLRPKPWVPHTFAQRPNELCTELRQLLPLAKSYSALLALLELCILLPAAGSQQSVY